MKIFDGHNDTLLELMLPDSGKERSFFERSEIGDLDLSRAHEGEYGGGLFAIFTPPMAGSPESEPHWGLTITETGYTMKLPGMLPWEYANSHAVGMIWFAQKLEHEAKGAVTIVKTAGELSRYFSGDALAMVLHLEGAEAVKEDLSNLEKLYDDGIRSIGITWSRLNAFGNGVPFIYPHSPDTGDGLTRAGKELVKKCNQLGIMLDLAHLNEKGFWDVAKLSDKPLVVSHGGVFGICTSTRNITDNQLRAIKDSNGMIGIMFEPINTRSDGKPNPQSTLMEIVHHIEYVVEKYGIEHVGFGSDFDGADMPTDLSDASQLQNLIIALRERGYGEESLEKIAHKNWLRVLRDTWKQ